MTPLDEACADLTALLPALIPALTRDNTPGDGHPILSAGAVVNTDVLHAMLTLTREIPATRARACRMTGEPCPRRPLSTCLTALPRLESRLRDLRLAGDKENFITRDVARWTRTVKFALGLRKPDMPIGANCPSALHAADYPDQPCELVAIGAEGFLRDDNTIWWQHAAVVWCAVCGATWPETQWNRLEKILESA